MTTQLDTMILSSGQARLTLCSVNGLLESVALLSEHLAGVGENMEIPSLNGLIVERGKMLEELVGMQASIHSALETVGQNSPEFQHFSELTKKIRKSGDLLVGALQKRKKEVVNNIQSAQNQVRLQSYAR
jgi:hypothetical protein